VRQLLDSAVAPVLTAIAALFLLGVTGIVAASGAIAQSRIVEAQAWLEAKGGLEPLEIVTSTGPHQFLVELARTEAQRVHGLMFRRSMPADRGMLFGFESERPVAMWMKNTYLPLDMIFIGKGGKVVGLAENTEPLSEKIIPSGAPALSVLEVNAGAAARIGLKVGDLVRHHLFAK
jgi:uncharacterized membrane protein (UPF0127 family)